jgi:hypothetical protein
VWASRAGGPQVAVVDDPGGDRAAVAVPQIGQDGLVDVVVAGTPGVDGGLLRELGGRDVRVFEPAGGAAGGSRRRAAPQPMPAAGGLGAGNSSNRARPRGRESRP